MDETKLLSLIELDQLEELLLDGARIPYSGGRLVNEQEAIEILDTLRESIPNELPKAYKILELRDKILGDAKEKSVQIIDNAKRQQDRMISTVEVRQEAERQVSELKQQAQKSCEAMLQATHQKVAQIERDMKENLAKLETQFIKRKTFN